MGRISPGPTRWPPGAERRLVPTETNLKPQSSGQRPCGACGSHFPSLLALPYCVPVDKVLEGYACGRSSDVAFLSAAGGDQRGSGCAAAWAPASPHTDFTSGLRRRKRGGGLVAGVWEFARPAVQCAGPSWRRPGRTFWWPPRPRLRLAVVVIFSPPKGVIHPKDTLEVIALFSAGPLHRLVPGGAVAGFPGPEGIVWRVHYNCMVQDKKHKDNVNRV